MPLISVLQQSKVAVVLLPQHNGLVVVAAVVVSSPRPAETMLVQKPLGATYWHPSGVLSE